MRFPFQRNIMICMILVLCCIDISISQIVGNPVEVRGVRQWTVGLQANYMQQDIDSLMTKSKRLVLRSTWGLTPHLDLFLLAGGAQMGIEAGETNFSDYSGETTFAFGGGIKVALQRISTERPVGLWAGLQMMNFPSSGSFLETLPNTDSGTYREFELKYHCLELQTSFGLIVPAGRFNIYASIVGLSIRREETKAEYLVAGTSKTLNGEERGIYKSGLLHAGLIGVELALPNRHALTLEVMLRNTRDYRVMVGICQTGIGKP